MRRLAYEAADCSLLSPDLAAGIRRVKGVKKIGVRLENWLTAEQSQSLWQAPGRERLKEKRDRARKRLTKAPCCRGVVFKCSNGRRSERSKNRKSRIGEPERLKTVLALGRRRYSS